FTNKSYVDQATARVLGWIDASDYGTVADAKFFSDGSITASDNTFTSSSASFTNADVGKTIIIAGAIDSETCLVTTIASRNSSTSVELTDAAETTVTGANGAYGTDDQPALSAAFAAARAAEKPLYIPKGDYLIADSIYDATLSGDNGFGCIVKGAGKHLTRIIP